MTEDVLEERLRDAGLRVTRPRVEVLRALDDHPHSSVDDLVGLVRARLGTVSTQAVYDVLKAFGETGLARRIEPSGSYARYEACVGDNHHHLVCRACGEIVDVACGTGRAPCLTPSDGAGYTVDEAVVTYWGLCPSCVAGAAAGAPAERRQPR